LHYSYGKSVLLVATRIAAPIVFSRRSVDLAKLVVEREVTHLSLVPHLAHALAGVPEFQRERAPHLRRITIAGGATAPGALAVLCARFPDAVMPMYGLTEAAPRLTAMPPEETARRPDSCGRAIHGVELKVLGDDGRTLGAGEVGEVAARGPNVARSYFRDPVATARAFRDGWVRTGDLGRIDKDGYLTLSGRRKDVIKVQGESVPASRIEDAVAALPGVAEVAAVGVFDERLGETIHVFVVLAAGADIGAESIREQCATRLGRARVPNGVSFVQDLPRTATGKVQKHLLRESAS
jgi:fatty-acyl-CoA synthase